LIDAGPGVGEEGGRVVAEGSVRDILRAAGGRTALYLDHLLGTSTAP
jgi:excinuclease ABC subunit A